jgi:Carboxypeptidase regulatory-like domain
MKRRKKQSVVTGPAGSFQLPLLKPGRYSVTVEKAGFRRVQQKTEVQLGQTSTVVAKLEIGETTQTVEITESLPLLQTEDANISTNVDLHTVQNIPNPGGDLTYIAQISPSVTMNTSNGGGFGNFTAFGLPATANLFTINGNDYNDPFLNLNNSGASNLLLGSNEIQEVAVVSLSTRKACALPDWSAIQRRGRHHKGQLASCGTELAKRDHSGSTHCWRTVVLRRVKRKHALLFGIAVRERISRHNVRDDSPELVSRSRILQHRPGAEEDVPPQ